MEGIVGVEERTQRVLRRAENRGRRALAKSFVRALFVEFLSEAIEALLLLEKVTCARTSSLCLERPVHSLMPAVLLRVPWLNSLWLNSEPHPPGTQRREPGKPGRREGASVVGEEGSRKAEFAKGLFEYCLRGTGLRTVECNTAEYVAAEGVRDRQRIAIAPVPKPKLTFEIGTPKFVWC